MGQIPHELMDETDVREQIAVLHEVAQGAKWSSPPRPVPSGGKSCQGTRQRLIRPRNTRALVTASVQGPRRARRGPRSRVAGIERAASSAELRREAPELAGGTEGRSTGNCQAIAALPDLGARIR